MDCGWDGSKRNETKRKIDELVSSDGVAWLGRDWQGRGGSWEACEDFMCAPCNTNEVFAASCRKRAKIVNISKWSEFKCS